MAEFANIYNNGLSVVSPWTANMDAGGFRLITLHAGSEASPSIQPTGDANTGIRFSAADTLDLVTGGADRWQVTSAGHLLATDDATYDIGASGATRPRHVYQSGNLVTGGSFTLTGAALFNGAVTLGDAAADAITITGTVASNVIFTDNSYDIGASGATRPRNIYNSGILNVGTGGTPAGQAYIKSAAAGTIGLVVDTAASATASAQEWRLNGTLYAKMVEQTALSVFALETLNLGNNVRGPYLAVGRNSSAGTEGPAASVLEMTKAGSTTVYLWVDNSGSSLFRINTGPPTGSSGAPTVSDTAGTVIGDQTSWGPEILAAGYKGKEVLRQWDDPTKALEAVLATKVYDFRYKDSSYLDADNQPAVFTGVIGFDRREWFLKNLGRQQIPSLNEINLHGFTVLAIQALHQRIVALEGMLN